MQSQETELENLKIELKGFIEASQKVEKDYLRSVAELEASQKKLA